MAGDPPASPPTDITRPRSLTEFYVTLSLIALQGFGGVIAIVQREMVERRRWMTREEFVEEWAVAQILPGPNVVNFMLLLGDRYFGFRGAIVGVAGVMSVPLAVAVLLTWVYGYYASNPAVAGALRGMGAVAAGMIGATGFKMFTALRHHPLGLPLCTAFAVLTFCAIALLRWPLLWVLPVVGAVSCTLTWRRIAP